MNNSLKKPKKKTEAKSVSSLLLLSVLFLAGPVFGLPISESILLGEVNIHFEKNLMEIETGDFAHINWKEFSIGQNEIVRFLQPDEHAIAINQVLSSNPTEIFGKLEAIGQIVLLNPSGVVFGQESCIDTGSFIASTFDLIESSSKDLRFGESHGSLKNKGAIYTRSGPVVFLSDVIENRGSITTQFELLFASGKQAQLQFDNVLNLNLEPTQLGKIENFGEITANSCSFISSTEGSIGIKNSGKIRASEKIIFESPGSIIEQRGDLICKTLERGGEVRILGNSNHLYETSFIDVSGKFGGGTVLIGGDYKGENPYIFNSEHTWSAFKSYITADAIEDGDGGKVILWGDSSNVFRGSVFARGGELSGNGGLIEISSKGMLDPMGKISAKAYNGQAGTLLFDPCVVTISTAADAGLFAAPPPYSFTGATANIDIVTLMGILNGGTSVVIDASASGTAGLGTITLNADADVPAGTTLTWNTPNSLTLIADGSIFIRNQIDATDGGTAAATPLIDLSAPVIEIGDPGFTIANVTGLTTATGAIRINSPTSLTVFDNTVGTAGITAGSIGAGNIDITTGSLSIQADTVGSMILANTDILINATGDISLISADSFTSIESANGAVSIIGGGDVNLLAGTGPVSYAQIASMGTGVSSQITGDYTLIGSNFPVTGYALLGMLGGTGDINVTGANYNLTSGVGVGATNALIGHATGAETGNLNVTATGATGIVINAGSSAAQIATQGPGSVMIDTTNITLNGSITPGATAAFCVIQSNLGGVRVNATGDITVNGAAGAVLNVAGIYARGPGFDVDITANNASIFGGTSINSFSRFQAQRGSVNIDLMGDLFIQGGALNITGISSAEFSAGDIIINARNLSIVGGVGVNGGAGISAGNITAPPGGNGSVIITLTGDMNLIGGAGPSAPVGISTVGSNSTNEIRISGIGSSSNLIMDTQAGGVGSVSLIQTFFGGAIDIFFSNDIQLTAGGATNPVTIIAGAATVDPMTIQAGRNLSLNTDSTIQHLGSGAIFLVADANFPAAPLLGTGSFNLDALASVDAASGELRIYTSQQSLNSILGMLNGSTFTPGAIFVDTDSEVWCSYYPSTISSGMPFTIYYKNCLQLVAEQAQVVVSESLADYHPYDQSPGWWATFSMTGLSLDGMEPFTTRYFLGRPLLKWFWTPKSYTAYLHDILPRDAEM